MANILDDNEFVEVEGRYYANPQVSLDESNAFIDNLRSTQQANNQQIQTDTYNLGTEISSNLGGLTSPVGEGGAGDAGLSYFTSRYQTPQTNAAVENLRAVAQAAALNDVLANEQEIWKKRYNDAYRRYQKSAYDRANAPTPSNPGGSGGQGDVEKKSLGGGGTSPIGKTKVSDNTFWDNIAGKGDWTISWEKNGKTYYGNVHYKTGFSNERYTGLDTSTGMSYGGQQALNYLQGITNSGGKIYDPNGKEVDAQTALTGNYGRH